MQRRRACRAMLSLTALLLADSGPAAATEARVMVFGAASLKTALDEIDQAYALQRQGNVKVSYAASSALAKQIEQGAPADIFISADQDWMNYLAERSLILGDSRTELLGNRIVLVASKDFKIDKVEIAPGFDLIGLLGGGRLSMGQVDSVPAGKYGKTALEKLEIWPTVKDHLAQVENVRAALALIARGETPLGIVYATDAVAEPGVKIIGIFPKDSYPAVIYPAAIMADCQNIAASRDFLRFLHANTAKVVFERQGFTVLGDK